MKKNIIKEYKKGCVTICYIQKEKDLYIVRTGKPSDSCCISWRYNDLDEAIFTAQDYYGNYITF